MNPHFFGSPEAIKEEEEDRPQEIPIFHLGVHEIYIPAPRRAGISEL